MPRCSKDANVRSSRQELRVSPPELTTGSTDQDVFRFPYLFPGNYDSTRIVVVECDPSGSPYSDRAIIDAIQDADLWNDIVYVGSMCLNYVKVIAFTSASLAGSFASRKVLTVKGLSARLIHYGNRELAIQLHWLPPDVPDATVSAKFEQFGVVKRIVHIKCALPNKRLIATTTRIVILDRKTEVDLVNIPYLTRIQGFRVAIHIKGRSPLCFKCKETGHLRKDCKASKCGKCGRYGHILAQCKSRSFAAVTATSSNSDEFILPVDMDLPAEEWPAIDETLQQEEQPESSEVRLMDASDGGTEAPCKDTSTSGAHSSDASSRTSTQNSGSQSAAIPGPSEAAYRSRSSATQPPPPISSRTGNHDAGEQRRPAVHQSLAQHNLADQHVGSLGHTMSGIAHRNSKPECEPSASRQELDMDGSSRQVSGADGRRHGASTRFKPYPMGLPHNYGDNASAKIRSGSEDHNPAASASQDSGLAQERTQTASSPHRLSISGRDAGGFSPYQDSRDTRQQRCSPEGGASAFAYHMWNTKSTLKGVWASWEEWWTYDGISGPDFWGLLNPDWSLCSKGLRQSPINIDPTSLLYDPSLRPLHVDKLRVSGRVTNTGHSVIFRADETPPSSSINITGGPLSYRYRFQEIHLHYGQTDDRGSEHTIGGYLFPAELQVYGYNSDLYPNMTEAISYHRSQGLVGLAILLQLGDLSNPELRVLTSQLHRITHRGQQAQLKYLSIRELLPDTDLYMTYEGSTTMPGCYETVTWIIMNKPIYITKQQLYALRKLMQGDERNPKAPLANNFRPPLPLNRRVVRTNIDFKRKEGSRCPTMYRNMHYEAKSWKNIP